MSNDVPNPNGISVGWCHSCGTLQLKDDMPLNDLPWADGPEPVCIEGDGEPWSLGVWDKGAHTEHCAWVSAARERLVDWAPVFSCNCFGTGERQDLLLPITRERRLATCEGQRTSSVTVKLRILQQ